MSKMRLVVRRLLWLAALFVAPLAAQAAEPAPLAAYGSLPDIESVALSHSGNRVAAAMTVAGRRVLLIMTSELDPIRMMPLGQDKIRSLEWIGDDNVLVVASQTDTLGPEFTRSQFEFFHAIIVPADPAQELRVVFDKDPAMLNAVFGTYGVRNIGGRWLAYFAGVERKRGTREYSLQNAGTGLFSVDAEKNERREVASAPPQGQGSAWLLGPDGTIAARMIIDIRSGNWSVRTRDGAVLAEGASPRGEVGLVALGRDGRSVIYSERLEGDSEVTRWFEVPLDGSAAPREFIKAEEVERLFIDRTNGQLLGFLRVGADQKPQFFAPAHQDVVTKIYQAFPNLDLNLMDWTPDFSRVLVRTSGNGDSGTWYMVDMARMRASAVGYERVALDPEHVGAISLVEYKASDGLELDGVLTLPPGIEAKNLPVVMLPHGGPHAHDDKVFDWWAQAFASRGYAVFQPNFRGSTNRDEGFMRASFGQWGKSMQTDISDGLAELARRGIVDPKRACIVGASYGGYAALAGVTLQQGVYRCSVAVAPVSDLGSLFSSEMNNRGRSGMLRRSLLEELGPRSGFDEVSPRRFARQADAPILLIHGKDDTVVPFNQSSAMVDALEDAGKPHKLVVLRAEDHWMSRAETRLQMLEEAVAFVREHNPPG